MDERNEYLEVFHSIILDGILFGMTGPGEMWINEWRILSEWGNTEKMFKYARKYFDDMYEVYNAPITEVDKEKVKEWIKTLYPDDHRFKEDFISTMLQAYDFDGASKAERKDINFTFTKIIKASEFDRDIQDFLSSYWEIINDSYHRFYPESNMIGNLEIHERIVKKLNDLGMKTDDGKYFHILIHFSW